MAGSIVSMGRVGGVGGPLHNLPPAPDPVSHSSKTWPQLGQTSFLTLTLYMQLQLGTAKCLKITSDSRSNFDPVFFSRAQRRTQQLCAVVCAHIRKLASWHCAIAHICLAFK